jgi:hypothetical protein
LASAGPHHPLIPANAGTQASRRCKTAFAWDQARAAGVAKTSNTKNTKEVKGAK